MDGYNVWVGYNFHLTMRVAIAMDQMYTTKWSIKAFILMKKLWVELFRKTHAKIFLPHCKMIKAHNIKQKKHNYFRYLNIKCAIPDPSSQTQKWVSQEFNSETEFKMPKVQASSGNAVVWTPTI